MKVEFSLVGTLLCLLRVVESSSNSYYDKDSFYQVPYFVHSPFNIANPILKYFYRYNPDTAQRNRQVVPDLYSSQRVINRDNFFRGHVEARPGSFHEAIPYKGVEGLKRTESDRVPLRDAVEHIPIEGKMNILVRSGGSDSSSDDSDDGPFSRGSVEAFPSPVTPYSASYDDTEVNAVVSQVDVLRDHYPRIGFRGNVEAPPSTPNENPLFKYYRVPERNSVSSIDDRWTQYVSGEHRPLTKSSYPWRRPTVTRQSESEAYKVVCYVESWAVYRPKPMDFDIKDIDPFACTHLIYSFAGLDEKDYTITSLDEKRDIVQGAYKATIALKESNPELKVMIALGGWAEGGLKYSQMVSTPERRKAFVDSLMVFMDKHGFDGLDLDWEYPGATDRGGVLADKENVAILCESIKEMFTTKGLVLTMAVPIAKVRIDDGYDIPRLSKCLNFFNLMSYDLRGPWDGVVDHHSPIAQRTTDKYIHRGLNLRDGIQLFVNEGAPKHKIVVGVPLYGRSFTLETPEKATPGSLSISMGNEGPYTKEKGYIAFYEVCILQRNGGWQVTRDEAGGPYMYKDNQWIGYDNEKYVEEKVSFAKREKLGGVMMWAIDLDDYLGMCGKRWPLMSTIRRTLNSPSSGLGEPEILSPVPEPEPEPSAPAMEQEKPEEQTTKPEQEQPNHMNSSDSYVGPNIKRASNFNCLQPGYYRKEASCETYNLCNEDDIGYEFQCLEGLVFDIRKKICTWPTDVPCGEAYAPLEFLTQEIDCGEDGLFSDPNNCDGYVWCRSRKAIVLPCSRGLHFNSRTGVCTTADNKFCIPGEMVHVPNDNIIKHADVAPLLRQTAPEEYKVVCYFSSWAWLRPEPGNFIPEYIDPLLCTHVIYAFAILDPTDLEIKSPDPWTDLDNMFYQRTLGIREMFTNTKVMLGLGGWTDSAGDKYSRLVNNPEARQKFVLHTVAVLTAYGFDGLDLHWEYPVCWQMDCNSGPSTDKQGYAALVRELRQAFLQQPIPLLLSAAISPARGVIARGYDVRILNDNLDFFNVMSYDYHGFWEKKTGHISPLYYREGDSYDSQNTDFSINYLISAGADPKKLVMGIPFYGQTYTLASSAQTSLQSPTTGPGTRGPVTLQNGMLSYAEICQTVRQRGWNKLQDNFGSIGPYATNKDQWISYDDPDMVMKKGEYIKKAGLGGAMVWTIDFDDFHNLCCSEAFPLLRALNRVLRSIPYQMPRPGGQCASSPAFTFAPTPLPPVTTTDRGKPAVKPTVDYGDLISNSTRPTRKPITSWTTAYTSPPTRRTTIYQPPTIYTPKTTRRTTIYQPPTRPPTIYTPPPTRRTTIYQPSTQPPTLTPPSTRRTTIYHPPTTKSTVRPLLDEGVAHITAGATCHGSSYYPHPIECSKFFQCVRNLIVESRCVPGLHWNKKLNLCDWPDQAKCYPDAIVGPPAPSPIRTTWQPMTTRRTTWYTTRRTTPSPIRTTTTWSAPTTDRRPSSTSTWWWTPAPASQTTTWWWTPRPTLHTTTERWTKPTTTTTVAPIWTYPSQIRTTPSPSGPCREGLTSEVVGHCGQYVHCVGGVFVVRNCPSGLHFHAKNKICDWPDNAKCSIAVRETTPETASNIIFPMQIAQISETHSASAPTGPAPAPTRPAPGSPCGSGSKIFARSPSSCRAFLICNQGSYEEKHCSEGLQWNHVKDICDWPDNVKCKAGDLPQQAPPVNVPVGPLGPPGGPPDSPVVDLPVDTSGPVTELEYVGPSSTKLSGDFMVVCYFTNWAVYRPGIGKYVPEDIDETTCTHVVYGFAVLDYSNLVIKSHDPYADVDMKFYERVIALKANGIKVTLAIGGWNDSQGDKYSRLVNSPTARQKFITHVVEFIKKYNFDGLDLDWEYPVCWQVECDKGPPSDKEGFASWVKELSSAFKPHGLLLSTAVSPSKKVIDLGYDVPSLSRYFDWIAVMTYDFHGHWDGKTGHVAPMSYHPDDDYDYFNADFAIRYWIEKGADRKKIVMGMPMYGQAFTLNDPSNHGLNSPATKGTAGQFTRAAGFLSYYEICNFIKQQSWTVVQDPEHRMGPYAYKGNQWVSFDDVNTIRRKSQYIRDMGLGGGMIWALDLDDFTNRCGQGRYPLLTTIKNILGPAIDPSKPVPPPSKPVDHPPQPDPEPQSPGNQPPPKPVPDPQTIPKPVQVLKPVPDSVDGYKVVCYYTNWAWYRQGEGKYLPEDVDPSLCTHINYAFAVLDQNTLLMKPHDSWADLDNNFYFRVSDLKKYGSKVLIALGGWNDSSGGKYSKLVNDPAARQRFNNHVLEFIQKYNFDGLDLDWEYPKCWQVNCNLGPDSDKDGFSAWIMELSALFKPLGLLLTAAVSPSYKVIDAGYDVPVLSKYLDIINVMNYDYHGQWDKITGHVAPMYPHPDDLEPKFNTDFTIKYWIQLGADPKKLALGMPMYGQSFTLTSASSNGLNVPTYGGGEAGPYTRARGFLAYYEICYFIRNQDWTVIRDPLDTMGPYAYKGQTWVGFDDIPQIEFKSNYIKQMGLGGAMIWALDLDDFRNRCGCEAYPLLKTINRVLRNYPSAVNSCPLLGEGSSSPISGNAESIPVTTAPWHTTPTITSKPPKVQSHEPAIDEGSPPIHEPEGPPNKEDIAQGAQPVFPPGFDERPPPVVGGDCEAGQFVSHTDCGKFYECYKGKLQEKSCPKGSHWDGKRACRRPSDANCRTRVVHPPTRVVESPPTRVVDGSPPTKVDGSHPTSVVNKPSLSPHEHARPAPVSDTKKETGDLGAAGQPCDAGQFKRHMQCAKFYECVQGSLLERTCVPGLHWDGHGRCNWPNKANCKTLDAQVQPHPPTPVATTTIPMPPSTKKPSTWWSHTTEATTKRYTPGDVQAHPPAPTTFEPPKTPTWWWTQSTEATTPSWTHPPGSLEVDGYKVVCYFTNWAWYRQGIAKYKPDDIDPNLCTHIIYGFAVLNPNTLLIKSHDAWADIDNKFYQKVTSQKQHGTKVLVAIGGWNDSKGGKYSQLVNDPAARKRFIENVVEFIKKYNFDGLDLDWEYPKCWQVDCSLGPDSDKAGFTAWIRELREAFTPYNWLLTAAVSPSYKVMDAGYDIPALSRYLDFINVMTYDYHGHWDKMTGHVAPMFHHPDSPAPQFNANYTIHYWIEQGADRKKLIMGMPLYGQAFTITDTKNTGLNSKGSKGQAGEYTRAAGFLAYYEICDRVLNKGYTLVRDPSGTIGPYAVGGNQWMGFDDVTMIRFKSNYIKQMGLGGGMVWALDLDDFNNRCNCEPHPLLRTIRRELRNDYPIAATRDCSLS